MERKREQLSSSIVLYGNCQVRALAAIFSADSTIRSVFDIAYVASYEDLASPISTVEPAVIAAAAVVFEQFSPNAFPHRHLLPSRCKTVTFPSIDLNLLWPLNSSNPFSIDRNAAYPAGQFPYGDSVIIDCVKRGMSVEQTLEYYQASAEEHFPKLDRFARLEKARLADRDAKCAVAMGDFVMTTFAERQLFWSNNHPTTGALRELCYRLIDSLTDFATVFHAVTIDATIATLPRDQNLELCKIPVHPAVARHFNLTWYPDLSSKAYTVRNAPATYDEYFFAMASEAVKVRDNAGEAVTQARPPSSALH